MNMKKSFTPIVKGAFVIVAIGATLILLAATTSFLPVRIVPVAFILMFGGAGIIAIFWKPARIPLDREVMLYTCAKCAKQITRSEVYVIEGKNVPENHRCRECYAKEAKKPED